MNNLYELPSGNIIEVNEEMHQIANDLANRFYVCYGYISRSSFDFSASQHPLEQTMYVMALECLDYEAEFGF